MSEESITLTFAGDTMASGTVASYLRNNGYQYPWKQVRKELIKSDLTMVNLETPVSERGEAEHKQYAYRSHPDLIKGMDWAGIDIVTVANNHSLDYGRQAFNDTLNHLNEFNIHYVGGGLNEQQAYQHKVLNIKGKDISFVAFSRVLPSVSWYARDNRSGLASGYQLERMYDVVKKASIHSDLTVVYLHWGKELANEPEPKEKGIAHHLIDLGADLVIGSHPHVLQGFEFYKGKLIAYSLGNFLFTTSYQKVARQSGILHVTIEPDHTQKAKLIPIILAKGTILFPKAEEKEEILKRMEQFSTNGVWKGNGYFVNVDQVYKRTK